MSETYPDREDSKIYGTRLIIFRRKGSGENGNYSFRAKIDGVRGYIRRTLKTSDPSKAMVLAEQEYEDLQVRKRGGFSLYELSVDKFFDDWITGQKTRLSTSRWNWKRSVYDRYVSGFMGRRNVSDLTKRIVDGYWDYRLNFWFSDEGEQRIKLNQKRISAKTQISQNFV